MKILSLSKWAKQNDYSYRGAYNRFLRGDLPQAYKNETGRILVKVEDDPIPLTTVVYARVSSHKQKDDLDRQAERMVQFANAKGWIVERVIKEVASGLNDKRPKLITLLSSQKRLRIVAEHKDRLTRFGFHYIETLLDGEVVIACLEDDDQNDLLQDMISVITSMVASYYGQKRGTVKVKKIISELEQE